MTLTAHPAANIFPLMDGAEFAALVADIKAHGLHDPVVLYEGQILDGRNRYRACEQANVVAKTVEWSPWDGESPVDYVLSRNLHRRHLNESQRAMVAAKALPLYEAEAHARMVATQNNDAARAASANLRGQGCSGEAEQPSPSAKRAGVTGTERGKASERAAAAANVSPRTVESAKAVLDKGSKELIALAETGVVAVSAAAHVATLPAAEQAAVVASGPKAVTDRARTVREEKRTKLSPFATRPSPASKHPPVAAETITLRVPAAYVGEIVDALKGLGFVARGHNEYRLQSA
jgi:ParB-like chromosome segregation protein Spo0J